MPSLAWSSAILRGINLGSHNRVPCPRCTSCSPYQVAASLSRVSATPSVELLWWDGCPSTEGAHALLREALRAEGLDPAAVQMREIETGEDAEREAFVGSPTIRVDGVEVAPVDGEPSGLTCRVYRLRDGRVSPTPDPEDIREAIRRATQ